MEAASFWRGVGDVPNEFRWAAPTAARCWSSTCATAMATPPSCPSDEDGFIRDLAAESSMRWRPTLPRRHLLVDERHRSHGADAALPRPIAAARCPLPDWRYGTARCPSSSPRCRRSCPTLRPPPRGEMRIGRAGPPAAGRALGADVDQAAQRRLRDAARPAGPSRFGALADSSQPTRDQPAAFCAGWRWLLQNHPHDSICGCSIDQVHAEMRTRFAWCRADRQRGDAASLEGIAGPVTSSRLQGGRFLVFNPSAFRGLT